MTVNMLYISSFSESPTLLNQKNLFHVNGNALVGHSDWQLKKISANANKIKKYSPIIK